MVNPFDLRTALLAKHAQHVVLIHFPIALFITAVRVRPHSAMDEATGHCGRSLLQPVSGSDFNGPGYRNRDTRMAVPARGPEAEGDPVAAPGIACVSSVDDLAGLVGAFPREAAGRSLAELPPGA